MKKFTAITVMGPLYCFAGAQMEKFFILAGCYLILSIAGMVAMIRIQCAQGCFLVVYVYADVLKIMQA